MLERAPDEATMLRRWDMNLDRDRELAIWQADNDASAGDAAICWLRQNPHIWQQWVTEAAADAVQEALAAGERPEGRPQE